MEPFGVAIGNTTALVRYVVMVAVCMAQVALCLGASVPGLDLLVGKPNRTLLAPWWRRRLRSYRPCGSGNVGGFGVGS